MTRVIVTGARGRLGAPLVSRLRSTADVEVIEVVSPRAAGTAGAVSVELGDAAQVQALVSANDADVIVHLGGVTPSATARDGFTVNELSTRAIVAASAGARVILASTAAIYGDERSRAVRETDTPDLRSDYATSKWAAEQALEGAEGQTIALRLFNVYGPGFDDSLVARLERSTVAAPAQLRRPVDEFVRDYVHVDDVVSVIVASLSIPLVSHHTALNVGTGIPVSNRRLVEAVSSYATVHTLPVDGPPSYSVADTGLTQTLFGFVPISRLPL